MRLHEKAALQEASKRRSADVERRREEIREMSEVNAEVRKQKFLNKQRAVEENILRKEEVATMKNEIDIGKYLCLQDKVQEDEFHVKQTRAKFNAHIAHC